MVNRFFALSMPFLFFFFRSLKAKLKRESFSIRLHWASNCEHVIMWWNLQNYVEPRNYETICLNSSYLILFREPQWAVTTVHITRRRWITQGSNKWNYFCLHLLTGGDKMWSPLTEILCSIQFLNAVKYWWIAIALLLYNCCLLCYVLWKNGKKERIDLCEKSASRCSIVRHCSRESLWKSWSLYFLRLRNDLIVQLELDIQKPSEAICQKLWDKQNFCFVASAVEAFLFNCGTPFFSFFDITAPFTFTKLKS